MNHWGRIVLGLSALSAAGWIAAGALGYRVADSATLARHTLVAFAALLALVLTHLWVAIYLLVVERLLRREGELGGERIAELKRARRRGQVGSSLAILAVVAQFTTANALYPARLAADWHALAALATVLALVAAAALERNALATAGSVAASVDR